MANAPKLAHDPADTYDVTKAKTLRRGARRSHRYTLATLRKALGLTQVQVAASMGVAQAAVSKVEARDDVLVSTLRAYADALGLDVELALVKGERRYVVELGSAEPGRRA